MKNPLTNMKAQNMGENTSKVFSGEKIKSKAVREMYGETPRFFAEQIRTRLDRGRDYSLVDVGIFKGELLDKLKEILSDYHFHTIGVDVNEQALVESSADEKVLANAGQLPLSDKSVDIAIMRYVLQWNSLLHQSEIIKELARVVKDFALVEHVGSGLDNPDDWRVAMDDLVDGAEVPKLKRGEHFFSSRDELEALMRESGIRFERLHERVIDDAAAVYIERFDLNEQEATMVRKMLEGNNFFVQTDWIIFPKE